MAGALLFLVLVGVVFYALWCAGDDWPEDPE